VSTSDIATQAQYNAAMKSAFLPQVRVAPELRAELEAALRPGETLSEFVEASVRDALAYRQVQAEFHTRGEAAWQAYRKSGVSHSADEMVAELRAMTAKKRRQLAR
jgi:Arc/MetJ-type ribon-helix-helix transcriptional regulator